MLHFFNKRRVKATRLLLFMQVLTASNQIYPPKKNKPHRNNARQTGTKLPLQPSPIAPIPFSDSIKNSSA